jgi:hypothetical protein
LPVDAFRQRLVALTVKNDREHRRDPRSNDRADYPDESLIDLSKTPVDLREPRFEPVLHGSEPAVDSVQPAIDSVEPLVDLFEDAFDTGHAGFKRLGHAFS